MSQLPFRAGAERKSIACLLPLNARRATACRVRRAACPLAFVPIKGAAAPPGSGTRVCAAAAWAEHINCSI